MDAPRRLRETGVPDEIEFGSTLCRTGHHLFPISRGMGQRIQHLQGIVGTMSQDCWRGQRGVLDPVKSAGNLTADKRWRCKCDSATAREQRDAGIYILMQTATSFRQSHRRQGNGAASLGNTNNGIPQWRGGI